MEQALELPEDPQALKRLVLDLVRENRQLKVKQDTLEEQIRLLLHKRFGSNSEKYRAEQSDLFNEAEAYCDDSAELDEAAPIESEAAAEVSPPAGASGQRGRKALPAELPRIDIIHDLPESLRQCSEGHTLVVIGEDISEQLDIIPAKVQVLRHIRKKYACPCVNDQ